MTNIILLDIRKYFPDLHPDHYAVINFFIVLPESQFLWVLDNIARKSGIGLDFHSFEFSEDRSGFLNFYNWSGKPEQTSAIRFSDFSPILQTIAKHFESTNPSESFKVERLLEKVDKILQ